jgi:hypothetical protein
MDLWMPRCMENHQVKICKGKYFDYVTLGQGIPRAHGCLQVGNLNTTLAQKINGQCN